MLKPARRLRDHWFYGPVFQSSSIYVQVILASVLINLFALASSLYIMTVYDRVIPNNAIESLMALTSIIVVVIIFDFIMKIIRGNFVDRASLKIDRRVSTNLFDKISRHDTTLGRWCKQVPCYQRLCRWNLSLLCVHSCYRRMSLT